MIDRCCISLNETCNLKCRYCHFQDKQNGGSSFELNTVLEILDNIHRYCQANRLSVFKIGIVGAGEPMLQKEIIFDLLAHVRARKYSEFKMYTITNGTLLKENDLKIFKQYENKINLCFSLDGYEELHNYGRARYADVMECIAQYKTIFGRSPSVNATVNAISVKNKEKLIAFFKQNDLMNVTFSKLVGYTCEDLYLSEKDFNDFMKYAESEGLHCRQFQVKPTYDCTMYGRLCGVGRTNIFITPIGIYPCGRFYKNDKYLLGNFNASLLEIEKAMARFVPVRGGECYYSQYVEGNQ